MVVSLAEIVNKQSNIVLKELEFGMSDFVYQGNIYQIIEKSLILLKLTKQEEKVVQIEVNLDLVFLVPCDRCLEDVQLPLKLTAKAEVDFSMTEAKRTEALDETSYINGYDLDVDRFLYEEVLINFPGKVLCKKDCKGICKSCGTNRNTGECSCNQTESDIRMSVIRDLFESFQKNEKERNQQ